MWGVTMWRCLPDWAAAGKARVVVLGWAGRVDRVAGRWDASKGWTSGPCGKRELNICL